MSRIQRTAAPGSSSGGGAVESVNGKTGVVTLAAADVSAISTTSESVTTSEIKARAVTEEKLAEAVALLLLGNERVTTGDLAAKAVTGEKIAEGTITESKLATAVATKLNEKGATVEEQKTGGTVTANEKHPTLAPTKLCFLNIRVLWKKESTEATVEILVNGAAVGPPDTVVNPATVANNQNYGIWVPPGQEYEIKATIVKGALEGLPKISTTVFK